MGMTRRTARLDLRRLQVPRAALTADELAPHVDFMSFGTNDLTQVLLPLHTVRSALASAYRATVDVMWLLP